MIFFARVVQEKSFTRAATKLRVSKSVVSGRISALEDQLRVRLLDRTTRKLSLTPDGVALFEQCARVAAAADQASAAVAGAGDTPHGVLRVNAPVVFAEEYLSEPMAAYLARYPGVRIDLSLSDKIVDLVDEGIDVALRITPSLKDTNLIARKLATDHTVLCAAPAYLERRGTPATPEDLVHHDCLVYSLLKVSDEWQFRDRGTRQPRTAPVEGRLCAGSGAVLRRAALAGMGLAVLPTFMVAADLAAGRLLTVVDSFRGVDLAIWAVYPHAPRPPTKVRAFVDLLVAAFRHPPWQQKPRTAILNRAR